MKARSGIAAETMAETMRTLDQTIWAKKCTRHDSIDRWMSMPIQSIFSPPAKPHSLVGYKLPDEGPFKKHIDGLVAEVPWERIHAWSRNE